MKSSWRIGLWLAVVVVAVIPVESPAATSDVFRLSTTLQGVIQNGSISNSNILKVKIRDVDLVNLAQGRTLGTPVPDNEILAFADHCATDLRLIVYDTSTESNLVTIGQGLNLDTAYSSRRNYKETMDALNIFNTTDDGAGSNGIVGGSFYYHGKIKIKTNYCPKSFGGQFTGVLRTAFPYVATNILCTNYIISCTVTNCIITNGTSDCVTNCLIGTDCWTNIFPSVQLINVIIPRSPISTGTKIGTLVEPEPPAF